MSEEAKFTHVDEFIDHGYMAGIKTSGDENYARWVLDYFRKPAMMQLDFLPYMKRHKLFCKCSSTVYRVTGASRFGDIYLQSNWDRDSGYEKRVSIDECSDWSRQAGEH